MRPRGSGCTSGTRRGPETQRGRQPDEIERVQQLAMESIAERLNEGLRDGVPCYYGQP